MVRSTVGGFAQGEFALRGCRLANVSAAWKKWRAIAKCAGGAVGAAPLVAPVAIRWSVAAGGDRLLTLLAARH